MRPRGQGRGCRYSSPQRWPSCSSPNPPGPREAQGRTLGRWPLAAPESGLLPLPGPAVLLQLRGQPRACGAWLLRHGLGAGSAGGAAVLPTDPGNSRGAARKPGPRACWKRRVSGRGAPVAAEERVHSTPGGVVCTLRSRSSAAEHSLRLCNPFIPNPPVLATHGVILHSEDRPRLPTRPHHVLLSLDF